MVEQTIETSGDLRCHRAHYDVTVMENRVKLPDMEMQDSIGDWCFKEMWGGSATLSELEIGVVLLFRI